MNSKKTTTEQKMREMLMDGRVLLQPLTIRCIRLDQAGDTGRRLDALIEITWGKQSARFAVEMKAIFTPKAFEDAVNKIKAATLPAGTFPMVLLPYLGESQLNELERAEISGIDLCGNGVVIVPNRLFVFRMGARNRFTSSAPIKNIYRKNSSMVPRVFLARPSFEKVSDVLAEINARNLLVSAFNRTAMGMGTVSKAIKVLEEDLIVSREQGPIRLVQPDKLLAKLLENYAPGKPVITRVRVSLALAELPGRLAALSEELNLPIVATGLGSVNRYAVMQRGETLSVYCPRPEALLARLPASESDRFPNLEIFATEDENTCFDSRPEEKTGFCWAAPVQTYLELMRGDKRDRETAEQVRVDLIRQSGGAA